MGIAYTFYILNKAGISKKNLFNWVKYLISHIFYVKEDENEGSNNLQTNGMDSEWNWSHVINLCTIKSNIFL